MLPFEVLSCTAIRVPARPSLETIFKIRGFIDPSDQNEQYITIQYIAIPNMRFEL